MTSNREPSRNKRLSRKEKEELVKKLYEQGYTYREIAKELKISVRDISRIIRGDEKKDEIDEIKERLSELEKKIESLERQQKSVWDVLIKFSKLIGKEGIPKEWKCPSCGEKGHVIIYFECPNCGHTEFWGYVNKHK